MGRPTFLFATAFSVALPAILLAPLPGHSQSVPTFGGRSLQTWQQLVVSDLDPDTRFRGMVALAKLQRPENRTSVLETFQRVVAREPISIVRSAAYLSMLSLGEDAWPEMQAALNSSDREEWRIAFYALADFFAPPPLPAAEGQLAALPNASDLPADSGLPELVAPALVKILREDRREFADREVAARALSGLFHSHPRESVSQLVLQAAQEAAKSRDIELAYAAIGLVGRLGRHAEPLVPWLIEIALRNEPARPPRDAEQIPADEVVPMLSRPMAAVEALGNLGAVAREAIPVLERLQNRHDGRGIYTAGRAHVALAEIRAAVSREEAQAEDDLSE